MFSHDDHDSASDLAPKTLDLSSVGGYTTVEREMVTAQETDEDGEENDEARIFQCNGSVKNISGEDLNADKKPAAVVIRNDCSYDDKKTSAKISLGYTDTRTMETDHVSDNDNSNCYHKQPAAAAISSDGNEKEPQLSAIMASSYTATVAGMDNNSDYVSRLTCKMEEPRTTRPLGHRNANAKTIATTTTTNTSSTITKPYAASVRNNDYYNKLARKLGRQNTTETTCQVQPPAVAIASANRCQHCETSGDIVNEKYYESKQKMLRENTDNDDDDDAARNLFNSCIGGNGDVPSVSYPREGHYEKTTVASESKYKNVVPSNDLIKERYYGSKQKKGIDSDEDNSEDDGPQYVFNSYNDDNEDIVTAPHSTNYPNNVNAKETADNYDEQDMPKPGVVHVPERAPGLRMISFQNRLCRYEEQHQQQNDDNLMTTIKKGENDIAHLLDVEKENEESNHANLPANVDDRSISISSNNLLLDEQYNPESIKAMRRNMTREKTKVAILVDEELEYDALDRRVEEVIRTTTIATAVEEIDDNDERKRRMLCIGSIVVVFVVAIVILVVILTREATNSNIEGFQPQPTPSPTNTQIPTLQTVKERGVLKCSLPTNAPGFSMLNATTKEHEGLEIDSCRAVAAAVMGVNYSIEVVHMPFRESFFALTNRSIDVLSRRVTHNMERDVHKSDTETGFSFSTPYLYDGLGFGGKPSFVECADNIQVYGNCSELKICVEKETTHYKILVDLFPVGSLVTSVNSADIVKKLISGDCNVIANEMSGLSEQFVRVQGYTGVYELGKSVLSKEPLAIVTRDDDHEWSQIVNWVLQAQFLAEAMNITQDNAVEFSNISPFGHKYNGMIINAISAVGNYGERYERYLEKIIPRQGLNMLYLDDNQLNNDNYNNNELIYSHPFGPIDNDGPEPTVVSRLRTITERGMLRCGIAEVRDGFAMFDTESQEWSGFDIDYCKAIAAAMFHSSSSVEYVNLTTTKNVFDSLIDNNVDVVCGVNIDIEANIERGVSFSQPYFYERKFKSRSLATYGIEDSQFSDFVYWVVSSTFYAEEKNITSSMSNDMPEVRLFGSRFYRMFRDTILITGNYGEIYERNVQPLLPRSGRNNLNTNNPMIGPQINPYIGF